MPRVMFTISYGIKPESRNGYMELIQEMKEHLTTVAKKNYSVFEQKGKENHFTEVFITNSVEEFDTLEDDTDEKTNDMLSRLSQYIDDGGTKYATLFETV